MNKYTAQWTCATLAILACATSLSAQPLLNLADTFHGIPFVSASRMALTADGTTLYASDYVSGLSVFRRDADDRFQLATTYLTGDLPGGVRDFALSPDQAHLYVPGRQGDDILVFARDAESGSLSLMQTITAGTGGVPDFAFPGSLVFSPSGDFLYVALGSPDAQQILVLARDPVAGTLSFVQLLAAPATGVAHPAIGELLISPGGDQLYSLGAPAISTFDRDPTSGRLSFVAAIERFNGADETLIQTSEGVVREDGTLYVIGVNGCYNSCRRFGIATLELDPLSGLPELLEVAPDSIREDLDTLVLSPDGRHLYLPDLDLDRPRISIFSTGTTDGRLELHGEFLGGPVARWSNVRSMVFDSEGRELVASGFEHRSLPRLGRDPATGELSFDSTAGEASAGILDPWDIAVSPDGKHVYVSSFFSETIGTFTWNDATGRLEPVSVNSSIDPELDGLGIELSLRISPDGSRVYAAGHILVSLARGANGELTPVSRLAPAGAVGSLLQMELSPDGAHIYLLGVFGIAVVSRDPATDDMEIVQVFEPDMTFHSLAFSPDGTSGYATVSLDCSSTPLCRALATIERDPATGRLTLGDVFLGPGPNAFESSGWVVVSPDGKHVYVNAVVLDASSIAAYARDPNDGSLTYLETVFDGEPAATLSGNRRLAISPDGRHLYVTKATDDALAIFERDPQTGRLTHFGNLEASDLDTDGLADPASVAVSPDSQLIFVAGKQRSAVASFSRRCLPAAGACASDDRFRLDVAWRDPAGRDGAGIPLAAAADSSRIFWFFERDNWEMLVKVLDGCDINDRHWVFAAATTDVETRLTVTDTWTGQRRTYVGPPGEAAPAVTDTAAFATCDVPAARFAATHLGEIPAAPNAPRAGCDDGTGLCISDRFQIVVRWRDAAGNDGQGQLVPIDSETSGAFWFFHPDNWEMLVKVLDGCAVNDRVWVFAASTTDVETSITVTDLETGARRVYDKSLGVAAPAVTDTDAFAACPIAVP